MESYYHALNRQRRLVHLSIGLFLRLLDGGCQRQCLELGLQPCGFRQQDCFLLGHLAISREQYCGEWLWPQRGTFGVKHMGVCLTMCMCVFITFFWFFDHFERCACEWFARTRGSWPHVPGPLSHDDRSRWQSTKKKKKKKKFLVFLPPLKKKKKKKKKS